MATPPEANHTTVDFSNKAVLIMLIVVIVVTVLNLFLFLSTVNSVMEKPATGAAVQPPTIVPDDGVDTTTGRVQLQIIAPEDRE